MLYRALFHNKEKKILHFIRFFVKKRLLQTLRALQMKIKGVNH
jgi:hypothetical protein